MGSLSSAVVSSKSKARITSGIVVISPITISGVNSKILVIPWPTSRLPVFPSSIL